jgi:hypothetical protein
MWCVILNGPRQPQFHQFLPQVGFVCHRTPPYWENGLLALARGDKARKKIRKSPVFHFSGRGRPKAKVGENKRTCPKAGPHVEEPRYSSFWCKTPLLARTLTT